MSASSDLILLPSGHTVELSLRSRNINNSHVPTEIAILLHPWSWLGGNMNDPVLRLIERPLLERGFHVLRYNSRGVGRSKGWPSLTGSQEAQDLREIVQWALQRVPTVRHLLLFGYSHGSLIVSQHLPLSSNDLRTSHILLSYPLGPRAWLTLFRSKAYTAALNALVRDPNSRVLVCCGDHDEFTGIESYREWSADLVAQSKEDQEGEGSETEGRVTVSCIDGASHFWAQEKANEMLAVVQHWLDERQS